MMETAMLMVLFHFTFTACLPEALNILAINDKRNMIAKDVLPQVLRYLKHKPLLREQKIHLTTFENGSYDDEQKILDAICSTYQGALSNGHPPHIVLDLTVSGALANAAKMFSLMMALPTVTTTPGQAGDIWHWRNLSSQEQKYLVQISPPSDTLPDIIRSISIHQNFTNLALLYDDSFDMVHKSNTLFINLPIRHILVKVKDKDNLSSELTRIRKLAVRNYFILGNLTTIRNVLNIVNMKQYFNKQFAWYAVTQDSGQLEEFNCKNGTVLLIQPKLRRKAEKKIEYLKTEFSLALYPDLDVVFYFDLFVQVLTALKSMYRGIEKENYLNYKSCDEFNQTRKYSRQNIDLRKHLKQVYNSPTVGSFHIDKNGDNRMEFDVKLEIVQIINGRVRTTQRVATLSAGLHQPITVNNDLAFKQFAPIECFRVTVALQKPFVMMDQSKTGNEAFSGYCIDLLEDIAKLLGFYYKIYLCPDNEFGYFTKAGNWSGLIGELVANKADIALSSLYATTEREKVIDYTLPYYDLVGISILMKKHAYTSSLFGFITVLERDVWLCMLIAYLFTSLLMWGFNIYTPYSSNKNDMLHTNVETREFTLTECLWFCITSLTPQGGGQAPRNLCGRLVAATWWLFAFVIIASYSANLAAFLSVSRMNTLIESLDDLQGQHKITYAPLNNSWVKTYFKRMAHIESEFYNIWKRMRVNADLRPEALEEFAVWEYPLNDKYTKLWRAMNAAGFPATLEEAVSRVLASKSSVEGFAFLGDNIDLMYLAMTNCELQVVGEQVSRKPFAMAVRQGSPLKDFLNFAILKLLNSRRLDILREYWWHKNPERKMCAEPYDQSDGINMYSIGGVFIIILVGIVLSCIALGFEYWLTIKNIYSHQNVSKNLHLEERIKKIKT